MMNVFIKYTLVVVVVLTAMTSCSNEQTLQEYYVANQENNDFILVDVPTSLIGQNINLLNEDQQKVFKTVRKINLMAYQTKDGDTAKMQTERDKVKNILSTDDYEELMKAKSDMGSMRLYYKGEETAIDEVIFFGADDNKGFMLARLLGDDMNISDMMRLAQTLEKTDIDVSQFSSMMEIFDNN